MAWLGLELERLARACARVPRALLVADLFADVSQMRARSLATAVQHADPITKTSVLSNGLSVATETIPGASTSTVGLWIDAGSRADASSASGTAHFLEVGRERREERVRRVFFF